VHTPLKELLADPAAQKIIERHLPRVEGPLAQVGAELSLIEIAAFAVGLIPLQLLRELSDELSAAA
jgi:hypothetical protein